MQPDATDWKIIEILRKENVPNSAISRQLEVSEGMVRRRIQRMKDAGILTIRAQINPDVLDQQQVAVITVTVTEAKLLDEKAKELSHLPGVLSSSIVSGRYDIIAEVLVDSNRGLVRFLTEILPQVKGIEKTESFLLLKNYRKYV